MSLHGDDTTEETPRRNRQDQGTSEEKNAKAEELTSDTHQEQGAPKEELLKPGDHPKAEELTSGTHQEQAAPKRSCPS